MPRYRYLCPNCGEFIAYHTDVELNGTPTCPDCSSTVQRLIPKHVTTVYAAWGFTHTDKALKADKNSVPKKLREKMLEPEKGYKSF